MPIEKVPVVHKFGIISHSQRQSLEQRLESKVPVPGQLNTFSRTKRIASEVTDDFVAKFNDSSYDGQEALLPTTNTMLLRAKRRVGIKDGGVGDHVNLPKAWAELTLLAQINNKDIREDSLEVLIASVNQAPLSTNHIPSLFYLAKSVLHWLRKSALNQPYLRTGEMKLLRLGHLVFIRLHHAYQTNQLHDHNEDKSSLKQYLEGVSEQQYIYRSFPGALLALRYMTEVGDIICQGIHNPPAQSRGSQSKIESQGGTVSTGDVSPTQSQATKGSIAHSLHMEKIIEDIEEEFHECSNTPSQMRSSSIVECPGEISVTLWHSLDVWRSMTHKGTGLQQAIQGLSICGTGLATELWVDVSCAFLILANASSFDLTILQTFQALAAGVLPRPAVISEVHARHIRHVCDNCLSTVTGHQTSYERVDEEVGASESEYLSHGQTPSIVRGLRDFASLSYLDKAGRTSRSESEETDSLRSNDDDNKSLVSSEASFADVSSVEGEETGTRKMSDRLRKERRTHSNLSKHRAKIPDDNSSSDDDDDLTSKPKSGKRSGSVRFQTKEGGGPQAAMATKSASTLPGGRGLERDATKGSLCSAQTRVSSVTLPVDDEVEKSEVATTSRTDTSILSEYSGIHGWPWELAYLYTEAMTSVALHGNSSLIQKVALLGSEAYRKPGVYRKTEAAVSSGMGLVDLLKFEFPEDKGVPMRDWSWRVRFSAVQGLVRLCRHCHGNSTKDGIRSVAWNSLMRHHTAERDLRVLEALKLAQIEVDLDNKMSIGDSSVSALPSHIADSLSMVMLPPLPPVVTVPEVTTRSRSRANRTPSKPHPASKKIPTRPSLRQEILLATAASEPPVDYSTRTNTDLMSVIREQWRKQLHEEEQEEEAERRRQEGRRILKAAERMGVETDEVPLDGMMGSEIGTGEEDGSRTLSPLSGRDSIGSRDEGGRREGRRLHQASPINKPSNEERRGTRQSKAMPKAVSFDDTLIM